MPEVGIPRDGGLADLLAEARAPQPRFATVIFERVMKRVAKGAAPAASQATLPAR